ncbi:MAG: hypothetical protein LUQ37_00905 [Methanoregulaceae archaeon]|jgi:hypothetical protein|nr:hypothetical protein [Methanoregulaceae archaeon]
MLVARMKMGQQQAAVERQGRRVPLKPRPRRAATKDTIAKRRIFWKIKKSRLIFGNTDHKVRITPIERIV